MNEFEGKLLFFDFDGTLANSEDYHRESMYLTLKKFGLTKEQTNFYIGKGMHDTEIFAKAAEDYAFTEHRLFDLRSLYEEKKKWFIKLALEKPIKGFPKLIALVNELPNDKYIITKNDYSVVQAFLNEWGLQDRFKSVTAMSDSDKTKADVIISMGFNPADCVLFDDVASTVREAVDAGMMGKLVTVDGEYVDLPN